jgi:hypothetical protein
MAGPGQPPVPLAPYPPQYPSEMPPPHPRGPQGNPPTRSRFRRFPWWVYLLVALCLCGGLATVAGSHKDVYIPLATATAGPGALLARTPTPPPLPAVATTAVVPKDALVGGIYTAVPPGVTVVVPTETPHFALVDTEPPIPAVVVTIPSTGDYTARAYLNNPQPAQNTTVTVFGELQKAGTPVPGAVMNTIWHYKTKDTPCEGAKTGADGVASCANKISRATIGFDVTIDVTLTAPDGTVLKTQTDFTPR